MRKNAYAALGWAVWNGVRGVGPIVIWYLKLQSSRRGAARLRRGAIVVGVGAGVAAVVGGVAVVTARRKATTNVP